MKKAQHAPQTQEERQEQLARIADNILYRLKDCEPAERAQLLRDYERIDRILARHGTTSTGADYSLLDAAFDELRAAAQEIDRGT